MHWNARFWPLLVFLTALPFHRPVLTRALGPAIAFPDLIFVAAAAALLVTAPRGSWRSSVPVLAVLAAGLLPSVAFATTPLRAGAQFLALLYVALISEATRRASGAELRLACLSALLLGAIAASTAGLVGVILDLLGAPAFDLCRRYPWIPQPRPTGPTESPAMLALVAAGGVFAATALHRLGRLQGRRFGGALAPLIMVILASQSRVVLAAGGGLVILALHQARRAQVRVLALLGLGAVIAALLATLTWRIVPLTATWPFVDLRPSPYSVCHEIAWSAFANRPWTGVGLGGFQTAWTEHYDPARHDAAYEGGAEELRGVPRKPHSTPLGYLAEAGVPGLAAVVLLGWLAWRRRDATLPESSAFLATVLLTSLTMDVINERSTWALIGLLGLAAAAPRAPPGTE